ncbi:hypothetical protein [Streptosporangium sp. KLBMP 9127]|nr:hypothetical protein [Streptosporangium sp. KLBMP 9127]
MNDVRGVDAVRGRRGVVRGGREVCMRTGEGVGGGRAIDTAMGGGVR